MLQIFQNDRFQRLLGRLLAQPNLDIESINASDSALHCFTLYTSLEFQQCCGNVA